MSEIDARRIAHECAVYFRRIGYSQELFQELIDLDFGQLPNREQEAISICQKLGVLEHIKAFVWNPMR